MTPRLAHLNAPTPATMTAIAPDIAFRDDSEAPQGESGWLLQSRFSLSRR